MKTIDSCLSRQLRRTKIPTMRVVRFLTSSSLYLAFNGSLVVVLAYSLYGIELSFMRLLAAFLATFSVYNLNRVTDRAEDAVNRPEVAAKGTRPFLFSSIAALLLGLTIGAMDGPWVLMVLASPLVLGLVYSVRLSKKVPRLKEVVGVKSLCVAFSWALTGSLLPEMMHSVLFEEVALVFLYIFVTLLVNTILFDVMDLKGDAVSGVRTIPLALGLGKTRKLLLGANTGLAVWLAYCLWRGLFLDFMPSLAFGVFYGYFLIGYFMSFGGKRLGAELMVDGEWIPLVTALRLFSK